MYAMITNGKLSDRLCVNKCGYKLDSIYMHIRTHIIIHFFTKIKHCLFSCVGVFVGPLRLFGCTLSLPGCIILSEKVTEPIGVSAPFDTSYTDVM